MTEKRTSDGATDRVKRAGEQVKDEAKVTARDPATGSARAGQATGEGARQVEKDAKQHPRAVAGGAATGAVGGAVVGGPPGAVIGAITGAARGLLAADALDVAKKKLSENRDDDGAHSADAGKAGARQSARQS